MAAAPGTNMGWIGMGLDMELDCDWIGYGVVW